MNSDIRDLNICEEWNWIKIFFLSDISLQVNLGVIWIKFYDGVF